jgi:hypothetical protein
MTLKRTGKLGEALEAYTKALDLQKKLADANPTVTDTQIFVSITINDIGDLLAEK